MSWHRIRGVIAAVGAGLAVGCASGTVARRPEPIYFSVEVEENGRMLGSPKLVGFEGRSITAERRSPGAALADYRLVLKPEGEGAGYKVQLDLDTPAGHRRTRVGLMHGEERSIRLDDSTQLRLMLMRVDSAEFRALMDRRLDQRQGTI